VCTVDNILCSGIVFNGMNCSTPFDAQVRLDGDGVLVLHGKFVNEDWQKALVISLGRCYYLPGGKYYKPSAKSVAVEIAPDFEASDADWDKLQALIRRHFPSPQFVEATFAREMRREIAVSPVKKPIRKTKPRSIENEIEPPKSAAKRLNEETFEEAGVLVD